MLDKRIGVEGVKVDVVLVVQLFHERGTEDYSGHDGEPNRFMLETLNSLH